MSVATNAKQQAVRMVLGMIEVVDGLMIVESVVEQMTEPMVVAARKQS